MCLNSDLSLNSDADRDVPRIIVDLSFGSRLTLTLCYILMLWHAYILMLLVMTYNYPILIMICAGLATGHFIFDLIKLPELPINYK